MARRWDEQPRSSAALSGELGAEATRDGAPSTQAAALTPETRYEHRGVLGEGGMGRVVLVRDRLLERDVAMKEVIPARAGDPDRRLEARLEREARVTARLEHPGIVPLYDAGRRPDGALYYTMRVVRGRSLEDVVADAADERARLGLVKHVHGAAQAVAWAHAHGVVHRDLKPANIMIGELGETQVVDWGLARELAPGPHGDDPESAPRDVAAEPDDPTLTRLGAIVGTPQYLSPEQAHGAPATARSDVFALGVTLYEVATGRVARPVESTEQALAHARAGFSPDPIGLPPDLFAIVRRATAFRADDRYADGRALAEDLSAWLDGRRVSAHGYTPTELLLRLLRAWRVPLLVGAAALLAGAIGLAIAFGEVRSQRDRAELEERRASAAEIRERAARRQAEEDLGRSLATAARARAGDGARPEAELLAARALTLLETPDARGVLLATSGVAAPRRLATSRLDGASGIPLQPGEVWSPSFDGRHALSWNETRLVMWDLVTRRPRWSRAGGAMAASHLAGEDRVIMTGGDAGVVLLAADDGRTLETLPGCCFLPRATPDARGWYASTAREGDSAIAIHVPGAAPLEVLHRRCSEHVRAFDGERAFLACVDGSFGLRAADGTVYEGRIGDASRGLGDVRLAGDAVLLPGGDVLVGGTKGEVLRVSLPDGRILRAAQLGRGVVFRLARSSDGSLAAAIDEQPGALLFDPTSLASLGRLPASEPVGVQFTRDARRVYTWGDTTMTLWEIAPTWPEALPVGQGVAALAVGRGRMSVAGNLGASTWDLDTGAALDHHAMIGVAKGVTLPDDFGAFFAGRVLDASIMRFAPGEAERARSIQRDVGGLRRMAQLTRDDGGHARRDRLLVAPDFGALVIFDDALDLVWRDERPCRTVDLALAASERTAAAICGIEGTLRRIELGPGAVSGSDLARDPRWRALTVAPDGTRFALARGDEVDLVDDLGRLAGILAARPGTDLLELAWSPDGRLVAGGGRGGQVWIWDASDGRLMAIVAGHHERVSTLAFDGRWLYSGSWDQTVRRVDLDRLDASAQPLLGGLERVWNRTAADIVSGGL